MFEAAALVAHEALRVGCNEHGAKTFDLMRAHTNRSGAPDAPEGQAQLVRASSRAGSPSKAGSSAQGHTGGS